MIIIESLFNDSKFIPINLIDYKQKYLAKYINNQSVLDALRNELTYSTLCYKKYKKKLLNDDLDDKWVAKKLFNALRYHESGLQLLRDKEISDVGKLNYIKHEIISMQINNKSIDEIYNYINSLIQEYIVEIFKMIA